MTTVPDDWRKARSSANTSSCVEVSYARREVRDSKNPAGPTLPAAPALIAAVKAGQFDR